MASATVVSPSAFDRLMMASMTGRPADSPRLRMKSRSTLRMSTGMRARAAAVEGAGGFGQPEQVCPLAVQRGLAGVEVLGRALIALGVSGVGGVGGVGGRVAPADEPDDPDRTVEPVADGEHQPVAEPVEHPPGPRPGAEPGGED